MGPRPTIAVIRIAGMYTAGDHIWETFVSGEPSGSGRMETIHGPGVTAPIPAVIPQHGVG